MKSLVTVTGVSNSYRLTALDAVKAALETSVAASDAFLNSAIDRQSAAAESWCRRIFARQAHSEIFRDVCADALSLRQYPATGIASVTEDGTALTGSDYELDGASGILYRLSSDARTEWSAAKVTIAYTAGYILPLQTTIGGVAHGAARDLPHDIEAAVIELAKMDFYARDRDPLLRSTNIPGVITEDFALRGAVGGMAGAMPGNVAAMLAPHRRVLAG